VKGFTYENTLTVLALTDNEVDNYLVIKKSSNKDEKLILR